MPPTIVLVHGAFAESSSWDRVIRSLEGPGHDVIAAANPLRGLAADAQSVTDLVSTIDGPVVLVGHSYGGMVITNVNANAGNITGLVYVAAFTPEPGGERLLFGSLSASPAARSATRAAARAPEQRHDRPLHRSPRSLHEQFAADVAGAKEATRMAATQRPVTLEALQAPSGDRPLWKGISRRGTWSPAKTATSPPSFQHFMAYRAGAPVAPSSSPPRRTPWPSRTPTRPARLILEAVSPVPVAAPDPRRRPR